MSTRQIVTWLCDPCLNAGVETVAVSTHKVAVDAYSTTVDLCADHDARVMGALRAMLGERGERSTICAYCGYVAASAKALAAHARFRADHGKARAA